MAENSNDGPDLQTRIYELEKGAKKNQRLNLMAKVLVPAVLGAFGAYAAIWSNLFQVKQLSSQQEVEYRKIEDAASFADETKRRAASELDVKLATVFQENYFVQGTDEAERRRFARQIVVAIGSDELRQALWSFLIDEPSQSDEERQEVRQALEFDTWKSNSPQWAWCFQVKREGVQYLVSCHYSRERCEYAHSGPGARTSCIYVNEIPESRYRLFPSGFRDSWWAYSETMFEEPFPSLP